MRSLQHKEIHKNPNLPFQGILIMKCNISRFFNVLFESACTAATCLWWPHTTARAERDKCRTSQPGTARAVFRVLDATQADVSSAKCYFSGKQLYAVTCNLSKSDKPQRELQTATPDTESHGSSAHGESRTPGWPIRGQQELPPPRCSASRIAPPGKETHGQVYVSSQNLHSLKNTYHLYLAAHTITSC